MPRQFFYAAQLKIFIDKFTCINFNKGFGPQPGNVLRSRFSTATCLQSCESQPPPSNNQEIVFAGTIKSSGETQYLPVYQCNASWEHKATLTGPSTGTDFELFLFKLNEVKQWVKIAQSINPTSNELITYNGTSGTYVFAVQSYPGTGGNGPYTVKITVPLSNTHFKIIPGSIPII